MLMSTVSNNQIIIFQNMSTPQINQPGRKC